MTAREIMMGFEGRIVRGSLLERLADQIEERIRSGELAEGDRMPPQAALAEEYGVSRPLVREALAALSARGYVVTKQGRGTFVRHPDAAHLADAFLQQTAMLSRPLTADDLYEARIAIETMAARLAAQRADADARRPLEDALAEMVASADKDLVAFTRADFSFHLAVAQASGNPLLPTMLGPLVRIIVSGVYETASDPAAARAGIRDHRRILAAVTRGDAAAAAKATEDHLLASRTFYPHELLPDTVVPAPLTGGV